MTADEWDARAERHIAVLIGRYLAEHPAPADSLLAGDLEQFADRLHRDGSARLSAIGARELVAVN